MIDQNPRQRYLDSSKFTLSEIIGGVLCLIPIVILIFMLFSELTATTNNSYNHAISQELHSYLQGPGKDIYLNEGGLE